MEIVLVGLVCALAGMGIGMLVARLTRKEAFSVIIYPYKEESGADGLFSDDRRAEVGYKFQLFVNGIPCFEAHKFQCRYLTNPKLALAKLRLLQRQH